MGHIKRHQERVVRDGPIAVPAKAPHMTPAQLHKLRTAPAGPSGTDQASRLRMAVSGRAAARSQAKPVVEAFAEAVESLHGITIAEKVERKKGLVEQYRPHVEALLDAGIEGEALFTFWVVWLFDIGNIGEFIDKAQRAIALRWRTGFASDLETFRFDMIFQWADDEFRARRGIEPYFGRMYARTDRMLEVVAAKYHKLAGDTKLREAEEHGQEGNAQAQKAAIEAALECFRMAESAYGQKAGVKTRIKDWTRKMGKLFAAATPAKPEQPASESDENAKDSPAAGEGPAQPEAPAGQTEGAGAAPAAGAPTGDK